MSAQPPADRIRWSLAVVAAWVLASSALAQNAPEALGATIAQRDCSQCHAVGLKDQSPNAAAPQFRKLDRRFVVQDLDPAVLAKLMARHAGMPRFRLTRREREGLVAYLKSLQAFKDASLSAPPDLVLLAGPPAL